MKAIQPYFVMATSEYHKEIMMKNGIAHFYRYCKNSHDIAEVMAVPDGCVDIMFEKDANGISGRAAGTVLEKRVIANENEKEFFGVRFLPGVLPAVLDVSLADLVASEIQIEDAFYNKDMLKKIEEAYDKGDWVEVFLNQYHKALHRLEEKGEGTTSEIVSFVRNEIMNTSGGITIAELAEETGYSERYVNKLFSQTTGINPKTFGKIMKFQKALQMINEKNISVKLTDIGAESGYYDQAHFIKEFKKYAAVTPKEYRKLITECDYNRRIVTKEFWE